MEVFPLDIQRLLLGKVVDGSGHFYRLRHLFCVNRLWRQRVSRYLVDIVDKEWLLEQVLKDFLISELKLDFMKWNMFDNLVQQWSPSLVGSFIMYHSAARKRSVPMQNFERIDWFKTVENCANKLFYTKHSILTDMKKKAKQDGIVKVQDRQIQKAENFIEKAKKEVDRWETQLEENLKKRDAARKVEAELDNKWQKKKVKF
jgi:hypothetical protein